MSRYGLVIALFDELVTEMFVLKLTGFFYGVVVVVGEQNKYRSEEYRVYCGEGGEGLVE